MAARPTGRVSRPIRAGPTDALIRYFVPIHARRDIPGLDYYFSSTLTGHDPQHNPDGTAVNPREDYDYGAADAAVGQPKFRPRLATGLQYHF